MSLRSMGLSSVLTFTVWTASITYLTIGEERERAMLFPDNYFFAERRLLNHTIMKENVKNLDDCELLCYLNDNCVSLNYEKDPDDTEPGHICELNNATHQKYDNDLTTDEHFYYRGSKSACDKNSPCQNDATCQSGFTLNGYRCLCPPGFTGKRCENDINECEAILRECHVNALCNNPNGSYVCTCKPGFTGDGQNCIDVDECKGNHYCHRNAKCTNSIGSHECQCHPSYIGNGHNCTADPCHGYTNLSDANRKSSYEIRNFPVLCDDKLTEGWYRFVGAAGTEMPATGVPEYRCGTDKSGWLNGAHPSAEDGEVPREVCFSWRNNECEHSTNIFVKSCGSHYIYKLVPLANCNMRYCGTD